MLKFLRNVQRLYTIAFYHYRPGLALPVLTEAISSVWSVISTSVSVPPVHAADIAVHDTSVVSSQICIAVAQVNMNPVSAPTIVNTHKLRMALFTR